VSAAVAAVFVALVLASVAAATGSRAAITSTVKVTFTDTSLKASPASPSAGKTTFVVVNRGKKTHLLMVKGPGVNGARTAKLAAGHSARLTVTLKPGAYTLSDPVGLGIYNVFFLDVVPSTTLTASGDGSVVSPTPTLPPMCGTGYTP
jgi:uncharacterized cupredoxin-like copper-binding protein